MELITLHTKNTTYQVGVNENGFLLHLYYGPRTEGDMTPLFKIVGEHDGFLGFTGSGQVRPDGDSDNSCWHGDVQFLQLHTKTET